ncbi:hypothetical protein K504DRAFT_472269 [Pleomassaria siparia CBS 279.74]|uniref:Uncharacterized protein n=1 Tax=Pleomassaria siparia CBS 279.74 TaxID=1314801 RepID=A0A6G1JW43_9PLEO|nr:hypothetical protein K504DRAFT_472269 [Pleomassaria siparia CBS 279.74]
MYLGATANTSARRDILAMFVLHSIVDQTYLPHVLGLGYHHLPLHRPTTRRTLPGVLCATATVVGASAVGLSFGREHPLDRPNNNKRKATPTPTPARNLDRKSISAAVHSSTTTHIPYSSSSPLPPPTASRSRASFAPQPSHDGYPSRMVRTTVNGRNSPAELDVDGIEFTTHVPSRRTSWIQRLSIMSTSQHSSRNSSPSPMSPTVSCSNGSMAFSHDGSTAPIVSKPSPSPLPPNKLVKRSLSVRVSSGEPLVQGSGSRMPSLRRPATSHQRSATLHQHHHQHTALIDNPMEEQPMPMRIDNDREYEHFFRAKVAKEKTLSKRMGSIANVKGMKRIFPDDKHKPTLLLAKSVSVGADEPDEMSSEDGESMFFVSRPGTPMSITAMIATATDAPNAESKPNRGRRSVDVPDESAWRRRSFSITDLLSPGTATKQRISKTPGAKLVRKSSQRVSSAPLLTMGKRRNSTAHGGSTSARRDSTDPALVGREISTSSEPVTTGNTRNDQHGGSSSSSSPLPALSSQRAGAAAEGTPASMHQSDVKPSAPATTNHIPPSPTLAHTGGRPSRHSVAPSEQASTLVGSDNEARGVGSGDEDDADLQSETVFDSLRTGATRSTSGARGPRIETIFDESPPKVKVTALRDLLPRGTFREQTIDGAPGQQSIAEEEESISTPVRTIVPERTIHESPSLPRGLAAPLFPSLVPTSPPDMPKPLSLGTLEWDSRTEDDDESSRWSVDDEEEEESWGDLPSRAPATLVAMPVSLGRHNPRLLASGSSPKLSTPQHLVMDHGDRDARSNIFDWSEQQPADKSSGNRTPPRPRTVHGKKDADRRGSRSVGRRVPSGLHARSQSVPVVPDAAGKRSTVVTNKFGTWGVGSKGVTEDWNDDFDFSDLHERATAGGAAAESQRIDSGTTMVVPKSIQEQQSNVLANIGLLREWGLLIEELKEQRIRAMALDILDGPHAGMWEEVDAMIDLADQEADHQGVPRLSPPSSPGFDEDAFDDVSGSSPNHGRSRHSSGLASEALGRNQLPPISQPHRPRRKSILPPNGDIFGPQSSPIPFTDGHDRPPPSPIMVSDADKPIIITRPRKDSEAKARFLIESLQTRRSTHEPVAEAQPVPATKKVPFDTATLRRIVPYVNTLTRKVKDTLREAEGLYSSPSTSLRNPQFSKMFAQTDNDVATQMKLMTVM